MVTHYFCKGCGSSVFFEIKAPPPEAVAAAEATGTKLPTLMGVNVSSPITTNFEGIGEDMTIVWLTLETAANGDGFRPGQVDDQAHGWLEARTTIRDIAIEDGKMSPGHFFQGVASGCQ